jgi:RNA-splicing ligase RtcB
MLILRSARTAARCRVPSQTLSASEPATGGWLQVGLGSGNHFLEVQAVDTIYEPDAGNTFGLFPGQVCE